MPKTASDPRNGMFGMLQYLRDIAQRCLEGRPLDRTAAMWLGRLLNDFLSRGSRALEEAVGMVQGHGGIPWWMEYAIRHRDAALRELARRFLGDLCVSAQARSIHAMAVRYAATAWLTDRTLADLPSRYAGTPNEWLWRAFHSGARMPIGERQLRSVLL